MAINHSNPTKPRIDRERRKFWARAPYNFVPLPEKVIIPEEELLTHEKYHTEGLTGYIECMLNTCSITYIRGMMTEEQFENQGRKKSDKLTEEEKKARAPFFAVDENDTVDNKPRPVIPGSTLRGMIRSIVEIAGYGRIRWVADKPTFSFRAVAAPSNDPLREPYRQALGSFGRNVRAGYLEKKGNQWYIRPAKTTVDMGWPDNEVYLKVKENDIGSTDIPGFTRLNSPNYHPQLNEVSFNVKFDKSKRGPYTKISQIGTPDAHYEYKGFLVCSGNMLENAKPGQKSPRKNHTLVLEKNNNEKPLPITEQAIKDYRASLTPFQKDELKANYGWHGGDWGCLTENKPVFYISDSDKVYYFGHSPNFRIPAVYQNENGEKCAANPLYFVPDEIRTGNEPDLADAIFGWIEEKGEINKKEGKQQRAGRVFFSDAHCTSTQNIWAVQEPVTPHILAGPKPTTFQHYLVQDKSKGHDPDIKVELAHYGTSPSETQIRGHKLYWHKGSNPDIKATASEQQHKSQLTSILPIKAGVTFSFTIHFENLQEYELGALLWSLTLPGEKEKTYRHKVGMGKSLGMGAVHVIPKLFLSNRTSRYQQLFDGNNWHTALRQEDYHEYIKTFEKYILKRLESDHKSLADLERIQSFLLLLEWQQEVDSQWLDQTRYMGIEYSLDKINEYKERPVLPDPHGVINQYEQLKSKSKGIGKADSITFKEKPRLKEQSQNFITGTIVKWFFNRGYGFIKPDDESNHVFLHKSQFRGNLRDLKENERVKFRIGISMKGRPEAKDVKIDK